MGNDHVISEAKKEDCLVLSDCDGEINILLFCSEEQKIFDVTMVF